MKSFNTYLTFDGNAREAMTFYQHCLGAELTVQTFAESKMEAPPGAEDRVLHARLEKASMALMASDTLPGMAFIQGNNFSVSVDCDNIAEIETFFASFSHGGKVTMELQDTFWGARFGMITDKFGINWMFNCELPKRG